MAAIARSASALRFRGKRLVLLGIAVLALASLAAILIFAWPRTNLLRKPMDLGSVDKYAVGSVTTIAKGKFHLVRLSEAEFIALSWREPGHGCTVPWRPTFSWPDPETGTVTSGWFRDPCGGSTFTREGVRVFGPAPRNMDRYPVSVVNGDVIVDTNQYVCGWSPPGARCGGPTPAN